MRLSANTDTSTTPFASRRARKVTTIDEPADEQRQQRRHEAAEEHERQQEQDREREQLGARRSFRRPARSRRRWRRRGRRASRRRRCSSLAEPLAASCCLVVGRLEVHGDQLRAAVARHQRAVAPSRRSWSTPPTAGSRARARGHALDLRSVRRRSTTAIRADRTGRSPAPRSSCASDCHAVVPRVVGAVGAELLGHAAAERRRRPARRRRRSRPPASGGACAMRASASNIGFSPSRRRSWISALHARAPVRDELVVGDARTRA